MIVEYIRYELEPERAEALVGAYQDAERVLASDPHSLGYDVARCVDEPGTVIVRMHWDSADGHLSGFLAGPAFPEFFGLVRPFVDGIADIRPYEPAGGPGFAA